MLSPPTVDQEVETLQTIRKKDGKLSSAFLLCFILVRKQKKKKEEACETLFRASWDNKALHWKLKFF